MKWDKIVCAGTLIGQPDPFVQDNVVVGLNNGKIIEVRSRNGFDYPEGVPVVDWSGYTVMPGLIDCHDHLGIDIGDHMALIHENDYVKAMRGVRNAETILNAGITALRSMGEKNFMDIYWKHAIDSGWIRGPRLVISCQLLVRTGGHGWFIGLEVDGPDALRRAVRTQVKAGADWVKFMLTGGSSSPGSDPLAPEYCPEEIKAIIEEAHRCGRRVAAHAHGGPGVKTAIEYGLDSVEHGTYLSEDDLRLMADNGTVLVITMGVKQAAATSTAVPEYFREKAARGVKHYIQTIQLAKKHNVKIVFGSDTLHADPKTELETLVQAGFTPETAIKTGTIRAAEFLGLDREIGSIEGGKQADMIAIEGNPLTDIDCVANIIAVMKNGDICFAN